MNWIDKIPLAVLVVITVLMALAPMSGGSHLMEKSNMLLSGTLVKPIDIFDLLMHGTPAVLLLIRLVRMVSKKPDSNE